MDDVGLMEELNGVGNLGHQGHPFEGLDLLEEQQSEDIKEKFWYLSDFH